MAVPGIDGTGGCSAQTAATTPGAAPADHDRRSTLAGLLTLASASCLAVTTELLPVGLLPNISRSLSVSESSVGLLMTIYAALCAASAVPLTMGTTRLRRKPLLLATLLGYALSNALVAFAPVFAVMAAGRTIGGVTHGLFFSLLIGYAPRMLSRNQVGRALAVVSAGASTGIVLGVPLSTSLGYAFGWRWPFLVLTLLSILALAGMRVLLPDVGHGSHTPPTVRTKTALVAVTTSNTLTYLGQFTLFTYISLLLTDAGLSTRFLGPALLLCGACGLAGLWYAGRGLDRNPRRTVIVVLGVLVVALIAIDASMPVLVPLLLATAVWNAAFGGIPSVYQTAAIRTHCATPELAGAWMNCTANIGIAGGSAVGAAMLQHGSLAYLPRMAAAFAASGLVLIVLCRRAFPAKP